MKDRFQLTRLLINKYHSLNSCDRPTFPFNSIFWIYLLRRMVRSVAHHVVNRTAHFSFGLASMPRMAGDLPSTYEGHARVAFELTDFNRLS